jgi:hypothetical protein
MSTPPIRPMHSYPATTASTAGVQALPEREGNRNSNDTGVAERVFVTVFQQEYLAHHGVDGGCRDGRGLALAAHDDAFAAAALTVPDSFFRQR